MRTGKVPISILFYHRVAEDMNPWTIRFKDFERQIDWLQDHFEFVSLADAQERLANGFNDEPCVSMTFDDGYAENCMQAIPLLLERRIPFTYFVTWQNVRDQIPFPHDVARGRPLPVNTVDSIRALAEMDVEIGSHTMTHPDIAKLSDPADLQREIVESKAQIEAAIGKPVRYFAFPYGLKRNLTSAAFELGRRAGYRGLCSAYGGYNHVGANPFHLQRFHGDPDLEYLKTWLDFDPRVRRIVPFKYVPTPESDDESTSQGQPFDSVADYQAASSPQ
jgi:peptidoglycan/xylan/chitin deacetylase (PgdA/CDA1 family)